MSSSNRHEREPDVISEGDYPNLGFVVDIVDPLPDVEGVKEDSVDIQLKPGPDGYQIDMWWTTEEGERKHCCEWLRFEDPRDLIEKAHPA